MCMTWEQLVYRLRYRKIQMKKIGNAPYMRQSRKIAQNDWYGDIEGIRFHIDLSRNMEICFITSQRPLPAPKGPAPSLEEALKLILKLPCSISGEYLKNHQLKYGILLAKTPDLLDRTLEKKKKGGFIIR